MQLSNNQYNDVERYPNWVPPGIKTHGEAAVRKLSQIAGFC
jgi:hypothetical protein